MFYYVVILFPLWAWTVQTITQ